MVVRRLAAIPTILLLAAGCAGTPVAPPEPVPAPESTEAPAEAEPLPATIGVRDSIAMLALSMIGVPYRYGGDDPGEGFDCSGLVYYAFTSNGQVVPRTSQEQYDAAEKIPLEDAAAGDLVFFADQERLSHVGIYLGDGRFVHAPSSGNTVSVASIDTPYYQRHLVGVGRLLP